MRLLTFKQLREKGYVIFSRQHWDRLCAAGEAPQKVQVGRHRVAWVEEEVMTWLRVRLDRRAPITSK